MRRRGGIPLEYRLPLEMVANEEPERLALEGELKALEDGWRDAEEVAGIADGLLVPEQISESLERMRRDHDGAAP